MKHLWYVLLLLIAMAGVLPAQQAPIAPDASVSSSNVHQWLHSGDPRMIAWAADFARNTHDKEIIAEMPALLEHWTMPVYGGDKSQKAQRSAITAALDALIQEDVQVPIATINAVAAFFPSQALILIERLPLSESRGTLNDWTYEATGEWDGRLLARVASMMLAKEPDAEFVARVVAASEEDLQIVVSSSDSGLLGSGMGACGDSIGREKPSGWPQIYAYGLVENESPNNSLVVDLDGDRIEYRRAEENEGSGTCNGVDWLNPATRHRLIAHWLGVADTDMAWGAKMWAVIVWTNRAAYHERLGEIIDEHREKLRATVEVLRQRGLMRGNQADGTMPRLVVSITCDMQPCPLK